MLPEHAGPGSQLADALMVPGAGRLPATWSDLYKVATEHLGGDRRVARWLVEDASGGEWPSVLEDAVTTRAGELFLSMLERRLAGEPVQYVLGHWAFRHLDLMVDRRVLIPRPETEVVVEVALAELRRSVARAPIVVDLGTGSGAIALSVATEAPSSLVWGTDGSTAALAVASANLAGTGARTAGRVRFVHGHWWSALPGDLRGQVDLVVTNPPYVSEAELVQLASEVRDWEPWAALVPGPSGLEAITEIVQGAPSWLCPEGVLVCELAPHQARDTAALALASGFGVAEVRQDLAGRDRALVARLRAP